MLISHSMGYVYHKTHFMYDIRMNFARFAFTLGEMTNFSEIRGMGEKRRGHARVCESACVCDALEQSTRRYLFLLSY